MEININSYGTKGLPYFGPKAIDAGRGEAVAALAEGFNALMAIAKKYHVPGNETALIDFGVTLKTLWGLGEYVVAGKGVVNQ